MLRKSVENYVLVVIPDVILNLYFMFISHTAVLIGALRRGSRRVPPRRFPVGNLPRGRFAPRGEKPRRFSPHPFFGVGEKRKRLYSFLHSSGLREIATANLQRQFHSRP